MITVDCVCFARTKTGAASTREMARLVNPGRRAFSVSPSIAQRPNDKPVMAILRETVNVWERRAPLAPQHVKTLVENGVKVIVQPSDRRAYSMQDYLKTGAEVQEDISEASLVLGVKLASPTSLLPDKTYAFFSHMCRRQTQNSQLLNAALEKNIRLVDYSRMVDRTGSRVLGFGKPAGEAGMINTLHVLGLRLLALGRYTPFVRIGPVHSYCSSESAKEAVRKAGEEISRGCLPYSIGPLTFVFTGTGLESQGAIEVFRELPHEFTSLKYLQRVTAANKVYACVLGTGDLYTRGCGGRIENDGPRADGERYRSIFSQKIAPYASCIINGLPWRQDLPRLLSVVELRELLQPKLILQADYHRSSHRLLVVCDIAEDPYGSVEFVKECYALDSPFCLYDAQSNTHVNSFYGDGVMVSSIDNMPSYAARRATAYFGSLLLPYIPDMLDSKATVTGPLAECNAHAVVKTAVITSDGREASYL